MSDSNVYAELGAAKWDAKANGIRAEIYRRVAVTPGVVVKQGIERWVRMDADMTVLEMLSIEEGTDEYEAAIVSAVERIVSSCYDEVDGDE